MKISPVIHDWLRLRKEATKEFQVGLEKDVGCIILFGPVSKKIVTYRTKRKIKLKKPELGNIKWKVNPAYQSTKIITSKLNTSTLKNKKKTKKSWNGKIYCFSNFKRINKFVEKFFRAT